MARKGAAVLVVDLVMKSQNRHRIFVEAVELGIALLEGGNMEIQNMLYKKLQGSDKCQNFFKVCILLLCLFILYLSIPDPS